MERSPIRPDRTSANGRSDSTSWGSLVRAQYRPFRTAWLSGNRVVERVMCAGCAGNARAVLSPCVLAQPGGFRIRAVVALLRPRLTAGLGATSQAGAWSANHARTTGNGPDVSMPQAAHRDVTGSDSAPPRHRSRHDAGCRVISSNL